MKPYYLLGSPKDFNAQLHGAPYKERGWHDERHGVNRRARKRAENKLARRVLKAEIVRLAVEA